MRESLFKEHMVSSVKRVSNHNPSIQILRILLRMCITLALISLPLALTAKTPSTPSASTSTITIKNNITPPMLTYWSYSPTSFSVKVNNEPLEPGNSKTITRDGNKVIVTYQCSFQNGAYKSAKEVEYEIRPDAKEANLTFSWNEKQRVVLSDSKIKHVKELK